MLVSYNYNKSNDEALAKAQQLTTTLSQAGLPTPRDTTEVARVFGTDGGAHAFLRMLEGTGGAPNTIHYRGSMVTFYYNRQAVGPFKCCGGIVYDTPTRDYQFDLDFLDPLKLPPLTPAFRDLNALGFAQELRPGK